MKEIEIKLEDELKIKALLFIDSVNNNNSKISNLEEEITLKNLEIKRLKNESEINKMKIFMEIKQFHPEEEGSLSRSLKKTDDNEVLLIESIVEKGDEDLSESLQEDLDGDMDDLLDSLNTLESLLKNDITPETFNSKLDINSDFISSENMQQMLDKLNNLKGLINDEDDDNEKN